MSELKILELFGGIGACTKALERQNIPHKVVDYVEIDKYAVKSYNAVHGTDFEPQDITKWDKNIEVDLIMHGSPCQDFSVAGKQAGGEEGSGTRSSLMYETLRIVKNLRPKYVIWENVKGLLSAKHRPNFDRYQSEMTALGYVNYWQVLNAKNYGVPQNRERVFTVSIRADVKRDCPFEFPEPMELTKTLGDMLEEEVDEKYYISSDQVDKLLASNYDQNKRFYHPDGVSPTINTMGGGQRQPKVVNIPQRVKVRKYQVDTEALRNTLRSHKNITNREIAEALGQPKTEVEHWFRNDDCFSIPSPEVWPKLKKLLGIATDEFDKSIMEFEEKDGVYEKTNRCYMADGIAPTLTSTDPAEKIITPDVSYCLDANYHKGTTVDGYLKKNRRQLVTVASVQKDNHLALPGAYGRNFGSKGKIQDIDKESSTLQAAMGVGGGNVPLVSPTYRIRKLTPKECWRLMGFDDADFEKAEKVNSNTQLYKQAGNSIVVNVLEGILSNLIGGES